MSWLNAMASGKRRLLFSFSKLIIFGAALFIASAFLYSQFIDLIKALTSISSASIFFYGLGWTVTLAYGILWLCVFLLFEMAKEDLIAMMRN